jgi:hypothetical protein
MARSLRAELVQAPDGWFYRSLERGSSSSEASNRSVDDLLWEAVLKAGTRGITYAELERRDGLTLDVAKKRLPGWRTEQRVGRAGAGTKSDPYRWYAYRRT